MSRSRRAAFWTDGYGGKARKVFKRVANKAIRNLRDDEAPADGKQYRKWFDSWTIRDWSFYAPKPVKGGRKLFGFVMESEEEMKKNRRKAKNK